MASNPDDLLERAERAMAEARALRLQNQRIIEQVRLQNFYTEQAVAMLRVEIYGSQRARSRSADCRGRLKNPSRNRGIGERARPIPLRSRWLPRQWPVGF
jgi:hypothetical protein